VANLDLDQPVLVGPTGFGDDRGAYRRLAQIYHAHYDTLVRLGVAARSTDPGRIPRGCISITAGTRRIQTRGNRLAPSARTPTN
jgi:hypothetical protein